MAQWASSGKYIYVLGVDYKRNEKKELTALRFGHTPVQYEEGCQVISFRHVGLSSHPVQRWTEICVLGSHAPGVSKFMHDHREFWDLVCVYGPVYTGGLRLAKALDLIHKAHRWFCPETVLVGLARLFEVPCFLKKHHGFLVTRDVLATWLFGDPSFRHKNPEVFAHIDRFTQLMNTLNVISLDDILRTGTDLPNMCVFNADHHGDESERRPETTRASGKSIAGPEP